VITDGHRTGDGRHKVADNPTSREFQIHSVQADRGHNVEMNSRYRLIATTTFVLMLFSGIITAKVANWKIFSNRAGWRIRYPAEWDTGSCRSCPDPRAPGVFVDFMPHEGADINGSVMVSPLRDKPRNMGLDAWFSEVERTANLNPRSSEHRFELNGKAALRVRYLNSAAGGTEMEAVYVVAGARTFSIEFSGNNRGTPLETLGNYLVFMRMVQSFEVQVR
jgi:hypothetical protein